MTSSTMGVDLSAFAEEQVFAADLSTLKEQLITFLNNLSSFEHEDMILISDAIQVIDRHRYSD